MSKQRPPELTRAPTDSKRDIDRSAARVGDGLYGGRVGRVSPLSRRESL